MCVGGGGGARACTHAHSSEKTVAVLSEAVAKTVSLYTGWEAFNARG